MELRQLEYFLAVCNTGNFTKAADKLCVAQPSVTKAVQQLEQELGVSLLDRTKKPITMTAEGHHFYERITVVLKDLHDSVREVQDIAKATADYKTLNIGMPPRTGMLLREMLLSTGSYRPQDMLFNIVERSSPDICKMLLEEKLDLGWIMNVGRPFGLKFISVQTQEVYCVLPPDLPLAEKEKLTFEELANESFAMDLTDISAIGCLVRERCRQAGFRPRTHFSSRVFPSTHITQSLARSGYGIMFTSIYDAREMTGVEIRPMDPPLTFEVGLAWKAKRVQTQREQTFLNYIRETYPRFLEQRENQELSDNLKE